LIPVGDNLEGTSKGPVLNQIVPVNEIEDEEDATTSDGSEFVENTQVNDGGTELESEEEVSNEISVDRNQRNMEFLKNSWANMADNEQDEALLLAELVRHDEQDNFQLVVSKRKQKRQKKLASQKKAYETRSKVRNSSLSK